MRLRRKIAPFIFGVSIGLLAGLGFFVFKVNDWFNKVKATAKDRITVIEQPVRNVVVEAEKKQENRERFRINLGKSAKVNYREVDSLIDRDEPIKIATDEMLTVKNVKVIRIDDKITEVDSAAAALSEVKEEEETGHFTIEFWKTPLNSKGFRFVKNKIMLYGFPDFNVALYQVDEAYFIKSSDHVYRVTATSEFKPLERVMDAELLAKIN